MHPTRKILEQGGIIEGEAFEVMLEEESQNEMPEILREINQHLVDIKKIMGYKNDLFYDSEHFNNQ